jgi:hypothetical protein
MDPRPSNSASAPAAWQRKPCPHCGTLNLAWASACVQCLSIFPDALEAAQTQSAHIEYLLQQLPGWHRSGMLSNGAHARLRSDYLLLHQQLADYAFQLEQHERVSPVDPTGSAATPASSPSADVAPSPFWPMDLPGIAPAMSVSAMPSSGLPSAAPYVPPPDPPRPPAGDGLRQFFQKHALQIIFALATVLVLAALRSMLGWDWIGDVAMRLLPAVPLGLTVMFWTFGQKTREENPWAAFVYHGLSGALSGFDVIALNKYWLPAPLPARPALLLAALAAACVTGALLRRWREIAYLHLFQMAALTVLFAVLQLLRVDVPPGDFHVTPLWLFGTAFLAYAFFCLLMARKSDEDSPASTSDATAQHATGNTQRVPREVSTAARADGLPLVVFGKSWKAAWTFWAHFSVVGVILLAAVNLALEAPNSDEFALLSLLSGLIYAGGAQLLQEARMVRVSGVFMLASGLLWLGGYHGPHVWERTCALLLALSALALVLARYNRQVSDDTGAGEQLAKAYLTLSEWGVAFATALTWSYVFATIGASESVLTGAHGINRLERLNGLAGAVLALLCGGYYALFARMESRPGLLYAAFATWGVALWSLLLALSAPHGLYPLTLVVYGSALVLLAALRLQRQDADAQTALSQGRQAQHNSGIALTSLGAIFAAVMPFTASLASAWLWSALTLAVAILVYVHQARQQVSAVYAYAALGCAAYVSALLTWRVLVPQPFRLADSLAVFALFTSGASVFLAYRRVSAHIPTSETAPNITHGAYADEGLWEACLLRTSLVAVFACLTEGLWNFGIGPNAAHYTLSLLPCLLSGKMLYVARWIGNREEDDTLRRCALTCVGIAAGVEIGLWCGLVAGVNGWHNDALRAWGIGLVALAWAWKLAAYVSRRWQKQDWWTGELTAAALTTGFVGILPLMIAAAKAGSGVLSFEAAFAAAFALFGLEALRTQAKTHTLLSLLIVAFAAVANRTLAPDAVTLTFAAYGIAYVVMALRCRTASLVCAASLTLTAAYLHHLLTLTAWYVTPPALSWPHFAFYAVQASLLWLLIGWQIRVRLNRADLAQPLLALAGGLALANAALALLSVQTPGEGKWSVLALGWVGAVWFALWVMEQGEICLHVATWNLLLAWGLVIYDRLGANVAFLDLYLLPVGLYLVSIGHLQSRRKRATEAQGLWTVGLLLTITPAFLAFWQHAGDIHTILFVGECLLSVLWGIAQRIRAFVLVGMGFIALYAGAVTVGHLPDVWGTLATLLVGVLLFVIGYAMLTRRAIMQRISTRLTAQWESWRGWR